LESPVANSFIFDFEMSKRTKALFASLLFLFVLDRGLFAVLDYCHRKSTFTTAESVVGLFLRQQKSYETLILGGSQAKHGLDPRLFPEPAFSLAWGGTDDAFASGVLSLVIQHGLAPRAVVLTVNPQNYMGPKGEEGYASELPLKLKYYYGQNDIVTRYIDETFALERVKFVSKLYRFNPSALNLLNAYRKVCLRGVDPVGAAILKTYGFSAAKPMDAQAAVPWIQDVKEQSRLAQLTAPSEVFHSERTRYLLDIVQKCREQRIELALVILPQLLGHDRGQTGASTAFLEGLAQSDGVQLIDLGWPTESIPGLDGTSWADRYHLSGPGATLATRELLRRWKR
jgi:hypothetical protein